MQSRTRRGIAMSVVAIVILVVAVAAVLLFMSMSNGNRERSQIDLFAAQFGSFDITIPASGELAARRQLEIKNQLEDRATITEIVDEGVFVREGQVLFRLNDEDIRNRIKDTEDAIDQSRNQLENAVANLEITRKTRESRLAEAELRIELAEIAMDAWKLGDDVSRQNQLATAIQTAELNHERLKERYEASLELFKQEFISKDEVDQDRIRWIEAEARLEQVELDQEVYMNYTRKQDEKRRESEVNQANEELLRINQRTQAEVDSATSDVESRQRQLERNEERMETLMRQLSYCTVRAPSDGLVVYFSSLQRDNRRDPERPEIGTQLSRSQTVIVLPDTTHMVAEVKVNEALSGLIQRGQRATIVSDAFPDRVFTGEVLSIGVLAEGGGWRDPNRRDYTVRISIQGENDLGLRPSMRCRATIFVDKVESAAHVPIQAIFRDGRRAFAYVPEGNGYAQKQVEIGRSSELFVEILSGLQAGEEVLLREPTPDRIVRTLEPLPPVDPAQEALQDDAEGGEAPWNSLPNAGDGPGSARPAGGSGDTGGQQRPGAVPGQGGPAAGGGGEQNRQRPQRPAGRTPNQTGQGGSDGNTSSSE